MDKAKVHLAVLKKHHFWVLCGVVALVSLFTWKKAASSLTQTFEANKQTIETANNAVKQIGADPNAPPVNAKHEARVQELHEQLKQQVVGAWEELYSRQEGLFKWPEKLTETGTIPPPGQEIPPRMREYYLNSVLDDEWDRVFNIVNLRQPKELDEGGQEEEASQDPPEMEGIVSWPEGMRNSIVSRYQSKSAPSDLKMRLTQEDIWIFESLAKIIEVTNTDATDPLNATIKGIEALDVAQYAMKGAQGDGGSSGMMAQMASGAGGGAMDAMMKGMGGANVKKAAAPEGMSDEDQQLLKDRYLNEKGQPLGPGAPQPFAEFKQIFVRMKFVMDQRRIPDLLAACANSELPVEVRRVRIKGGLGGGSTAQIASSAPAPSRNSGGAGGAQSKMGAAMNQGSGGMGGMGNMSGMAGNAMGKMAGAMNMGGGAGGQGSMMSGKGGGGMSAGDMKLDVETGPYDAVVEVCGVVYIYNPPDPSKLGTGSAADPSERSFALPEAEEGTGS